MHRGYCQPQVGSAASEHLNSVDWFLHTDNQSSTRFLTSECTNYALDGQPQRRSESQPCDPILTLQLISPLLLIHPNKNIASIPDSRPTIYRTTSYRRRRERAHDSIDGCSPFNVKAYLACLYDLVDVLSYSGESNLMIPDSVLP